MTAWLVSTNSRGLTPAWSARTRMGVPCSSDPLTMRTSWPAIRMYRLKTSEGTPNPATWPRWRGPLAYGQATAERTFMGPDPRRHGSPSRPGPREPVRDYPRRAARCIVGTTARSWVRRRNTVLAALTGMSLSAAAGLNAYIPFLVVALVARFTDYIVLPAGYEWIESNWAIGIGSVLLVAEVVLDKVPAVDTVNDTIQTFIR